MSKPIIPINNSEEELKGEQMVMPEFADTPVAPAVVNAPVKDDVTDLDLSVTSKKRFRFNKDNNRIVEINTSDMNILSRIAEAYPKLQVLQEKASKLMDDVSFDGDDNQTSASMKKVANRLNKVDGEMRELIDYIFDSDVSSKAAPDGSMYDPFEGSFRFEYILTVLINQYEKNLTHEYSQMERQFKSHTDKYTKG